jgi:integrase/recombinase XerC
MASAARANWRTLLAAFANRLRATRSARTAVTYEGIACRFLGTVGNGVIPSRLAVDRFLDTPLKCGKHSSASTRNQELAALRALADFAVGSELWPKDPTEGIEFLREPPHHPAVLSFPEVQRLFRAVRRDQPLHRRDLAMLAVLFTVGLRVHELVGLNVDQVDVASASLVAVHGKGGTVHDLPLEPKTLSLLQDWIQHRAAVASPHESAIFVSRRGSRLSIRSVERLFEKLRTVSGTRKHVTPHTARHSAATLALTRGSDVSDVGELLRHSDLNTTRRYLHLVDTRRRKVTEALSVVVPDTLLPEELKDSQTISTTGETANLSVKHDLDGQHDLVDVGRKTAS